MGVAKVVMEWNGSNYLPLMFLFWVLGGLGYVYVYG